MIIDSLVITIGILIIQKFAYYLGKTAGIKEGYSACIKHNKYKEPK